MKMKEMYVAPELEVMEVCVEKGFAATGETGGKTDTDWGPGGY